MKHTAFLICMLLLTTCVFAQTPGDNTVEVVYSGTTATVAVADNVTQFLTVTQQGAPPSPAKSPTS